MVLKEEKKRIFLALLQMAKTKEEGQLLSHLHYNTLKQNKRIVVLD